MQPSGSVTIEDGVMTKDLAEICEGGVSCVDTAAFLRAIRARHEAR